MANAVAGVGTVFERWNGAGWDTIAEINSIEGPSMDKDNIEVTSLDTAGGYDEFITGFMDGGQLTLNMNFTRSGYEAMKQDFEIDVPRDYRVTLSDDEETDIYFEGLVIEIPLTMEAEDKLTADVTIQVTGEVTVGSGAAESSEDESFGSYTFYDSFTDDDDTLLENHTPDTANFSWIDSLPSGLKVWSISSNKVILYRKYNALVSCCFDSGKTDIDISVDLTIPDANFYQGGFAIRQYSAASYWAVKILRYPSSGIDPPEIRIYKTSSVVASIEVAHEVGTKTLRVVTSGNYFTVYWGGVKVIDNYESDGAYATETVHGLLGFYYDDYVQVRYDNFKIV